MRTSIRMTLIAGAAAVALGLGTAAAVAATGGGDDGPGVVEQTSTPGPTVDDRTPRPTPSDVATPLTVPGVGDDHGVDDPATHDLGDDHGSGGHGADD